MSVSRRGFLGAAVGGAGALAIGGTAQAGGAKHFAGHPGRYGLLHDTTLCVGCRSCETACNEVNKLPVPAPPAGNMAVFDKPRRTTHQAVTVVNRYRKAEPGKPAIFRKQQCMHCNEPCCASVCLVKAFSKTPEGPVLYDEDVCIGCRYCVMACPYYALSYEYEDPITPRVMRCTMCYDRIKEGKQPGCSEACPNGAITYGKRKDLIKLAHERIRKHPERYVDHLFGEHEFGGTSWMVLAGIPFDELGLHNAGGTHTPLPEIGTAFLSVVPLVITIYPGLLAGFYAFTKRKERISEQEARARVVEAVMRADEETKAKLAAAATKAGKDKERAVTLAVKKALAEDEKRRAEEAKAAAGEEVSK
jgi:formate dehydrogenase iron-sulfur subunit